MKAYGLFEAKNKLSELIRLLSTVGSITITNRGKSVAKLVLPDQEESFEDHIRQLQTTGQLTAPHPSKSVKPLGKRPGALKRFLAERALEDS